MAVTRNRNEPKNERANEKDKESTRDRDRPPAGAKQPSVCTKLSFLSQYVARRETARLDSISFVGFDKKEAYRGPEEARGRGIGKHWINYALLEYVLIFPFCCFKRVSSCHTFNEAVLEYISLLLAGIFGELGNIFCEAKCPSSEQITYFILLCFISDGPSAGKKNRAYLIFVRNCINWSIFEISQENILFFVCLFVLGFFLYRGEWLTSRVFI